MKIISLIVMFTLLMNVVVAHGDESFEDAEELINAKVDCVDLTEEELEIIGDYYMEQMHPGEAHEAMDAMMGGEGSEQLHQMHVQLAKSSYCGEKSMMDGMHSGMQANGGMENMMNGFGMGSTFGLSVLWLMNLAVGAFVVGIIFWWTQRLVGKK